MGSVASYVANCRIQIKAKEGNIKAKNTVKQLIKENEYEGYNDDHERNFFNSFKELKKDIYIKSDEDDIILWKDEYDNISLKKFKEIHNITEEIFSYPVGVYELEDMFIDEDQIKKLGGVDGIDNLKLSYLDYIILENGYLEISIETIWEEIYYLSNNFAQKDITDILMKYINICQENNYEFKIILTGNGNSN